MRANRHRMKETEDSIIGQITRAGQELTTYDNNNQEQDAKSESHLLDTRTQSPTLLSVRYEEKLKKKKKKTKEDTYVSIHQLAIVLHFISAVLVRNVSLFCVLIDVGGQFLALVGKRMNELS